MQSLQRRVLHDYEANPDDPEQLSIKLGDVLWCPAEPVVDGWLTVIHSVTNQRGIVPVAYCGEEEAPAAQVKVIEEHPLMEVVEIEEHPPITISENNSAQAAVATTTTAAVAPVAIDPKLEKYFKMKRAGLPEGAIENALRRDGMDPKLFYDAVKAQNGGVEGDGSNGGSGIGAEVLDPELEKYRKMQKNGLPEGAVRQAMLRDGVDSSRLYGGPVVVPQKVVIAITPRTDKPVAAPSAAPKASPLDDIQRRAQERQQRLDSGASPVQRELAPAPSPTSATASSSTVASPLDDIKRRALERQQRVDNGQSVSKPVTPTTSPAAAVPVVPDWRANLKKRDSSSSTPPVTPPANASPSVPSWKLGLKKTESASPATVAATPEPAKPNWKAQLKPTDYTPVIPPVAATAVATPKSTPTTPSAVAPTTPPVAAPAVSPKVAPVATPVAAPIVAPVEPTLEEHPEMEEFALEEVHDIVEELEPVAAVVPVAVPQPAPVAKPQPTLVTKPQPALVAKPQPAAVPFAAVQLKPTDFTPAVTNIEPKPAVAFAAVKLKQTDFTPDLAAAAAAAPMAAVTSPVLRPALLRTVPPPPVAASPSDVPAWKVQLKPVFTKPPVTPVAEPLAGAAVTTPTVATPVTASPPSWGVPLKPVFSKPAVAESSPIAAVAEPSPVAAAAPAVAPAPVVTVAPKPKADECDAFRVDIRKGLNTCVCGKLKAKHVACDTYIMAKFNICRCGFSQSEHFTRPAAALPAMRTTNLPPRAAPGPPPPLEVVDVPLPPRAAPPPPPPALPESAPPPALVEEEIVHFEEMHFEELAVESHDHLPPREPPAPPVMSGTWACQYCTADNTLENMFCIVCERERYPDATIAPQSVHEWTCAFCTFNNHVDKPFCEMCNGARPLLDHPAPTRKRAFG
ncbi:hypothetical protein BASA81_007123 [Batrachochytrium salamandrivorans]|nr:hypothetical protein BASA81_007123 [Batrachochytrium salamandrivorans]